MCIPVVSQAVTPTEWAWGGHVPNILGYRTLGIHWEIPNI